MATLGEALQHGWRLHQTGNLAAAENIYRQVLNARSDYAPAWCYLGMVCYDLKRYSESEQAYRRALQLQPEFPVAWSNLANTLSAQDRFEEAEAACREASRQQPDYATPYLNLGALLTKQGRLEEATECFQKAVELAPENAAAHRNLSGALVRQGKLDEAESNSQRALALNPQMPEAHRNAALVRLLRGELAQGWIDYEWRWKCSDLDLPTAPQPQWNGEPLQNKSLLLTAEQGLGDTLHFIRFARELKAQGGSLSAWVQKPLLPLLGQSDLPVDRWVPMSDPLPVTDYYIPLLSIPRVLGVTLETIPAETPYLQAKSELVAAWQDRLPSDGLRIGIAWQGNPDHHADRQRSFALRHFGPLARLPGVRLFSLQKGAGSEQIAEVDFAVTDFGESLDAEAGPFMDTAAVMTNLDLIVTSDTSIAHLAGALNCRVWVALGIAPDWRWLLDREDSPWYPRMRLFRQRTLHDWEEVFQRITAAVKETFPAATQPVAEDDALVAPSPVAAENSTAASPEPNRRMIATPLSPGELLARIARLESEAAFLAEGVSDEPQPGDVDETVRRRQLDELRGLAHASWGQVDEIDTLQAQLKECQVARHAAQQDLQRLLEQQEPGEPLVRSIRALLAHEAQVQQLIREVDAAVAERVERSSG